MKANYWIFLKNCPKYSPNVSRLQKNAPYMRAQKPKGTGFPNLPLLVILKSFMFLFMYYCKKHHFQSPSSELNVTEVCTMSMRASRKTKTPDIKRMKNDNGTHCNYCSMFMLINIIVLLLRNDDFIYKVVS